MSDPNDVLTTQLMLLTRPQAYLRRVLRRTDIAAYRMAQTFHSHPLPAHWARTIGMWGGVTDHHEIQKRSNTEYAALKMFRQRNALTTRIQRRPQWDLAISAYLKWQMEGEDDPTNAPTIASHFGILPIELRIYCDRMELVRLELGVDVGDLLDTENYRQVEVLWTPHSETIDGMVLSTYAQIDG